MFLQSGWPFDKIHGYTFKRLIDFFFKLIIQSPFSEIYLGIKFDATYSHTFTLSKCCPIYFLFGCDGRIEFSGGADLLDCFLDGIVSTVWIVGIASGSKHFFFTSQSIAILIEYSIG